MAEKDPNSVDKQITEELLSPYSFVASKSIVDYRQSALQKKTYKTTVDEDDEYTEYIKKLYGSYDSFLREKQLLQDIHVFDPDTDYMLDVTVIKKDAAYKTDHMSAQEALLESLSGVCTIWFIKNNGSTRRLTCTLKSSLIPNSQYDIRKNFFRPMKYDRLGVWDINEQKWKSFYMGRVFKFVRDDSVSTE